MTQRLAQRRCSIDVCEKVNKHTVVTRVYVSAQLCLTLLPMDCSSPGSSMKFSRQECWRGCHFLLQGIVPTQGMLLDEFFQEYIIQESLLEFTINAIATSFFVVVVALPELCYLCMLTIHLL